MKLWKILLVATTAIILPLALVSVGYAQELNCWGLRPTRTDEEKPCEYRLASLSQDKEETQESTEVFPRNEGSELEDANSDHES